MLHRRYIVVIIVLLGWVTGETCAQPSLNPWARFTQPILREPAASIGNYTAGCLAGAVALPLDGLGYHVMRPSRRRHYGHPLLIEAVTVLARQAWERQWGVLFIGDLGQARGGPTLTGHRSHQTGLDVDIWFDMLPPRSNHVPSHEEREQRHARSMLLPRSGLLNKQFWQSANEDVLRAAANLPVVERIFVNARIKQHLCERYRGAAWLSKIRPWWRHDDHFHVRLYCPPDSPLCVKQDPLPPGDGCDESLAWWFTAEASAPPPPKKPLPVPMPPLPAACQALLSVD